MVPSAETLAAIHAVYPVEPVEPGYRGEVASRYRFLDGAGEVGFISSVTQPFCRDCTRARLSADGRVYTCLFAAAGFDLRGSLRRGITDQELSALVRGVWSRRADRYSEERADLERRGAADQPRVEMYTIGG